MSKLTSEDVEGQMRVLGAFTYGELCEWRAGREQGAVRTQHYDHDRLIDRTIQKLRRKGLISFTREAGKVVWRFNADGSPA